MKVKIYLEIAGLAINENNNPAPAGMCISFDVADGTKLPEYDEFVKSIKKDGLLRLTGLDGMVKPDDVRFITQEEYEREYGDEEQEG